MKKLSLLLAFVPSMALAHPGEHSGLVFGRSLVHLLTEPDHLAIIAVVVIAGVVLRRIWKGRAL